MRRSSALLVGLLFWGLVLGWAPGARAQATPPLSEVEPNDTCASAQNLGAVGAELTLAGLIEEESPKVDFFRVTATPRGILEITLRGQTSGEGTLPDPFLGVFGGECGDVIAINDDSDGLDSRLRARTPVDGVLVIGATSCCDDTFTTGGGTDGTYTLSITSRPLLGSIGGQFVDAETGQPPDPGQAAIAIELLECLDEACERISFAASGMADGEGRFFFDGATDAAPLVAGRYLLLINSNRYELVGGLIIDAGPGEDVDLGPVAIERIPLIGAITLRLVDQVTGRPLRNDREPFAYANLFRLNDGGFEEFIDSATPAEDGRVTFSPQLQQSLMRPGTYRVVGFADQYTPAVSELFPVGKGEEIDRGELALQPNPIRVIKPVMCTDIPRWGGTCRYSVTLVNNRGRAISLKAWSPIGVSQPQGFFSNFQYQTAKIVRIARGRQGTVRFQFYVPGDVAAGTVICPSVFVADNERGFYFKPDLAFSLSCAVKEPDGAFRVVDAEEGRRLQQGAAGTPGAMRSER